MANALKRIWKQIPLHRLTQGSTLTVQSSVPITSITFKPSWRDNGMIHMEHNLCQTQQPLELHVDESGDAKTSLGRLAPKVDLSLSANDPPKDVVVTGGGRPTNSSFAPSNNSLHKTKLIDRVIYDDGTIARIDKTTVVPEGSVRTDYQDGIAHIHKTDGKHEQRRNEGSFCHLIVETPEAVNLVCELQSGDITVTGKVEGDTSFTTQKGNIQVKKLRGHNIALEASGSVYVSSLLEAQTLSIKTNRGRIRAKQIHGSTVNISADITDFDASSKKDGSGIAISDGSGAFDRAYDGSHVVAEIFDGPDDEGSIVDISSLFVSSGHGGGATIQCQGSPNKRSVRIKSHHGPLQVEATGTLFPRAINRSTERSYPVVELGGVNGSCEVFVRGFLERSNASINDNACEVHVDSFSPDTISMVCCDEGDIGITFDRKVESDLRIVSLPDASNLEACTALLADEDNDTMISKVLTELQCGKGQRGAKKKLEMMTKAFVENKEWSIQHDQLLYISGKVENRSDEPDSRFDRKIHPASVGKIRIESAAEQALASFANPTSTNGESDSLSSPRPLLAVACTGSVRVETVSWLGAIARRYGLGETKRELGRTASRSGRQLYSRENRKQ